MVTTSNLPPQVQHVFDQRLLSIPTPNFVHGVFADKRTMPSKSGNVLRMSRYNRLPTSVAPLDNQGTTPPPTLVDRIDVDAKIQFYGQYINLTEEVSLTSQDNVLNSMARLLGISLRETEDELMMNLLRSTASIVNCTAGVNGDQPTELTRADIDDVARSLRSNDAMPIDEIIQGENRFGTAPVRNCYFAMAHTDLTGSQGLDNVDGFIHVANYPTQQNILLSEYGSVGNVRFVVSSKGSVTQGASALNQPVYDAFIVGQEAYACVELDNYSSQFIYRAPIYEGPLSRYGSVGWKMAQAYAILNDDFMFRLRCTLA